MRFELAYYALEPEIRMIAPWRGGELDSPDRLIEFAEKHLIPISKDERGGASFLPTPIFCTRPPKARCWKIPGTRRRINVIRAPSTQSSAGHALYIEVDFERGDAIAVNGQKMLAATLLTHLNKLGHDHGIGRLDLVENRYVGMKSRGMYETPGGRFARRPSRHRIDYAGPRRGASEGRDHAAL